MKGAGRVGENSATANGYDFFFWGDENVLNLYHDDGCTILNILKAIELYTFNSWTMWYVNYISIKLCLKKKKKNRDNPYI